MTHNPWGNNKNAPLAVKILAWLCIPITLFFLAHTIIRFAFSSSLNYEIWIDEIYLGLWVVAPIFLYLTGSLISEKRLRIITNCALLLFGSCYLLNLANLYEWVDIPHLQYPMSVALITILVVWFKHLYRTGALKFTGTLKKLAVTFAVMYGISFVLMVLIGYGLIRIPYFTYVVFTPLIALIIVWTIHLMRSRHDINAIFKFIWFYGLCYSFIIHKFVPHNHEAGNFHIASLFAFPVMMGIGLYLFFANKNRSYEQTP